MSLYDTVLAKSNVQFWEIDILLFYSNFCIKDVLKTSYSLDLFVFEV